MQLDFYTNVSRLSNNIVIRGIRNGKEVRFKEPYEPTLYLQNDKEDYGFKTLYGENLKPIRFDSMRALKDFTDQNSGSNLTVYGFPHHHSQFSLENFSDTVDKFNRDYIRVFNIDIEVTSTTGFPEPKDADAPITALCIHDSIADKFVTMGIGEWNPDLSALPQDVLDKVVYIKCDDEYGLLNKLLNYWSTFTPDIVTGWNIETFDLPYIHNRLEKLGFDTRKLSPWNNVRIRDIRNSQGYNTQIACEILGVETLDYLALYKKNKVQDSYKLDNIAQVELSEKKSLGSMEMLDMSKTPFVDSIPNNTYDLSEDDLEYNRFVELRNERVRLVMEDPEANKNLIKELERKERQAAFQAFISYNIQDVNLVKRLDEKMGLIDANIMIAYEACMNFGEVASPVRTWDCLINKEMWKNNQRPPYHIDSHRAESGGIPGGYVKEPQIGKHGWCVSFDLNSLYPHLIMQFNISPETLNERERFLPMCSDAERLPKLLAHEDFKRIPGHSHSASGYVFSNDFEGIIPRLMRKMYSDRKAYKKKMLAAQSAGEDDSIYNLRQYVLKILLNSGYGALINKYFRFFDKRMGMSITLSGQYVIQVAEREINKWMNKVLGTTNKDYVIAIDTDSNYVNFQPLVDKFFSDKSQAELTDIIDKIANEQVQKVLDDGFDEAKEYLTAYDQKMVMEREAIASSAFWTAKKRYAMMVHDMEGVRKDKVKIQGLEAIRSSTPYVCRKPLLDIIEKTLTETEDDVQKYIADFKAEFMKMPVEDIAMPRSMNNLNKYVERDGSIRKGCPPHTRGAIVFNQLLERYDLTYIWEKIVSGEKGKFVYLREPNNVGADALSFTSTLPKEFDVEQYVDREKMFEKIIIDPAMNILAPIGWNHEEKLTLESFFG